MAGSSPAGGPGHGGASLPPPSVYNETVGETVKGQLGREWNGVMEVSFIYSLPTLHTPQHPPALHRVFTSLPPTLPIKIEVAELMTHSGASLWNSVNLTKVDTKLKIGTITTVSINSEEHRAEVYSWLESRGAPGQAHPLLLKGSW